MRNNRGRNLRRVREQRELTIDIGAGIHQQCAARRLQQDGRTSAPQPSLKEIYDLAGKYDTTRQSGEFNFHVVDFNQNALRPFLTPVLAPNRLVSVSLNGKGSASADARGESSVKAELKLANLVVEDPQSKLPKSPLAAGVQLDGSLRQQSLSLRQLPERLRYTRQSVENLRI